MLHAISCLGRISSICAVCRVRVFIARHLQHALLGQGLASETSVHSAIVELLLRRRPRGRSLSREITCICTNMTISVHLQAVFSRDMINRTIVRREMPPC